MRLWSKDGHALQAEMRKEIRAWKIAQGGRSDLWGRSMEAIKYIKNASSHYWDRQEAWTGYEITSFQKYTKIDAHSPNSPVLHGAKGLLVGDVIHQDKAHGSTVVCSGDGPVALLARCVLQAETCGSSATVSLLIIIALSCSATLIWPHTAYFIVLNEETSISVVLIQNEGVILALMEQPLRLLHLQKIMSAAVHGVETIVMLTGLHWWHAQFRTWFHGLRWLILSSPQQNNCSTVLHAPAYSEIVSLESSL